MPPRAGRSARAGLADLHQPEDLRPRRGTRRRLPLPRARDRRGRQRRAGDGVRVRARPPGAVRADDRLGARLARQQPRTRLDLHGRPRRGPRMPADPQRPGRRRLGSLRGHLGPRPDGRARRHVRLRGARTRRRGQRGRPGDLPLPARHGRRGRDDRVRPGADRQLVEPGLVVRRASPGRASSAASSTPAACSRTGRAARARTATTSRRPPTAATPSSCARRTAPGTWATPSPTPSSSTAPRRRRRCSRSRPPRSQTTPLHAGSSWRRPARSPSAASPAKGRSGPGSRARAAAATTSPPRATGTTSSWCARPTGRAT